MAELSVYDIMDLVDRANKEAKMIPEDPARGLSDLTSDEIRAINNRIAEISENEDVFTCLWSARGAIYDAVRAVKRENPGTKFVGFGAGGDNELDLVKVRPKDIKRDGTALTDWTTDVTTAGIADYESDTGGAYIKLDKSEARVYCGWVDKASTPAALGVLIDHIGEQKKYRVDLLWGLTRDYPLIVHKPVLLRPNTSYKVQANYNITGTDALQVVGVIVKIASQIVF